MRSPPVDLPVTRVQAALQERWGLQTASIDYVPEGGGSHHWKAVDGHGRAHFVTVDDLDEKPWMGGTRQEATNGLGRAYATAAALRSESGLEFVVAPTGTADGELFHPVDDRYTVALFPYLTGRSYPFGAFPDELLREAAVDMLVAIHRSAGAPRGLVPSHVPTFGGRSDLEAFLLEPGRPWDGGPFSETARPLFTARTDELAGMVRGFDHLVEASTFDQRDLVVTHGEPHPGNLMTVDGRTLLIDWDTVGLAPRERDLSLVAGPAGEGLDRYELSAGCGVDLRLIVLYRARWYLDDLASAVRMFRNPHRDSADTRRWLDALPARLRELPHWLAVVS